MTSTFLRLGGAERDEALSQVADAAEERLRTKGSLTAQEFRVLASSHDALRYEIRDGLLAHLTGVALHRLDERASEVADQYTARGRVDSTLLAQLASAVALRHTVFNLIGQSEAPASGQDT